MSEKARPKKSYRVPLVVVLPALALIAAGGKLYTTGVLFFLSLLNGLSAITLVPLVFVGVGKTRIRHTFALVGVALLLACACWVMAITEESVPGAGWDPRAPEQGSVAFSTLKTPTSKQVRSILFSLEHDANLGLLLHGHRAGHAAFTRNVKHGINMRVIAKLSRAIGMDQLHVGTAVGKMSENREEVLSNIDALKTEWGSFKRTLPVASGGLYPGVVDELMNIFGNDVVIQAGGGIHGHPKGTVCGAIAMRQAVEATLKKITLKEYATTHKELQLALELWQ